MCIIRSFWPEVFSKEILTKLEIPEIGGGQLPLELGNGDKLFVVGANGSGKSVLFQH